MIAPLAKFIDWYALQVASVFLISARKCDRGNPNEIKMKLKKVT